MSRSCTYVILTRQVDGSQASRRRWGVVAASLGRRRGVIVASRGRSLRQVDGSQASRISAASNQPLKTGLVAGADFLIPDTSKWRGTRLCGPLLETPLVFQPAGPVRRTLLVKKKMTSPTSNSEINSNSQTGPACVFAGCANRAVRTSSPQRGGGSVIRPPNGEKGT
jgi:hypothetical protein